MNIEPKQRVTRAFAYQENDGTIDLDSISDSIGSVKYKVLEGCMGWRFRYPDRYNQDEEWQRILTYGNVIEVSVSLSQEFGCTK